MEWISLASVCLAGAASPGPSLAVVVSASLSGGKLNGLVAAWAHALGVGLYAGLTVLGISALVTADQRIFITIQTLGALYLLWLARSLWFNVAPDEANAQLSPAKTRSTARDGFAIAFLNPKLAVFMLALFSQFVHPDANTSTKFLMAITALLVDGLWYSLITMVFTRGKWIAALRENAGRIDRVFGILLAIVAVVILLRVIQSL
ncbi:LysE family translocator [Congregibacter brevis]|uniref:LysE family translocator n=1 Tax=Congregibacter brevis TaxID=3081201 RepID=A0ABZ0I954_9GAMM|nr:LysE family translocator [Congregibacter sp. IMCC45268]